MLGLLLTTSGWVNVQKCQRRGNEASPDRLRGYNKIIDGRQSYTST